MKDLNRDKKVVLKDLSKRDIIITNAGKVGSVIIMDVSDYIKEAKRQLYDSKNYKILAKDPKWNNRKSVQKRTFDIWKHCKWIEKAIS